MLENYVQLLNKTEEASERSRIIKELSGMLRMDRKQLYRKLRAHGWDSGRDRRRDAGEVRVPPESLELLSAHMLQAVRENGKKTMYIPVARQILESQGVDFGDVSNEHLARLLKERSLDLSSQTGGMTSHIRMRSLHPNHVHLVDPSVCLVYYLPDGSQGLRRLGRQRIIEDSEAYKNKPFLQGKEELKVWRYVLTDHLTNSVVVRYYQQPGESMVALWDFLMYAWSPKEDPLYAFHGVPRWMVWDSGSANVSKPIANALEALGVRTHAHMPKAPRVKGSVEKMNDIVETSFESRLRLQPVNSVDELNEAAQRWCALYNADRIEGYNSTLERFGVRLNRLDAWLSIRPEELRELPEEAKELLAYQPVERKVAGDLTVSIVHPRLKRRALYRVGGMPGVRVGMKVLVQPLLMDTSGAAKVKSQWEGEMVEHTVLPVEFDEFGLPVDAPVWGENYKSNADTYIEMLNKELKNLTGPGKIPFEDMNDGAGSLALDAIRDQGGKVKVFPRKGTVIDPRAEPLRILNHVEAAKYLKARSGDGERNWYRLAVQLWPGGVSEKELDEYLTELEGGQACAR